MIRLFETENHLVTRKPVFFGFNRLTDFCTCSQPCEALKFSIPSCFASSRAIFLMYPEVRVIFCFSASSITASITCSISGKFEDLDLFLNLLSLASDSWSNLSPMAKKHRISERRDKGWGPVRVSVEPWWSPFLVYLVGILVVLK